MKTLIVIMSFLVCLQTSANYVESTPFPALSPLESTFSVVNIRGPRGQRHAVGPWANQIPAGYTGPRRFHYRLYQVQGRAPLIFLNVGLGGASDSDQSNFLASLLQRHGYHVVVLGSTFRDDFAAVGGSSAYVGQARIDAYDLYTKMVTIKGALQSKGVRVSHWGLSGYSFGALVSAFMARIDDREKYFNFSKVVLVNPPVDLLYSMQQLDQYYSEFASQSGGEKAKLALRYAQYRSAMSKGSFAPDRHLQTIRKVGLRRQDLRALVGKAFRDTLQDVVFFSQQVVDVGILPMGSSQNRKRFAGRFGYYDYVSKFVAGFYQNSLEGRQLWNKFYGQKQAYSLQFLNRHNSLYGIESTLRNNGRLVLFHNDDDFLVRPNDIEFLRRSLGSRLRLFRKGGHLGNLWFRPFQVEYVRQWQQAFH